MAGFGGNTWGSYGGGVTPINAAPSIIAALTYGGQIGGQVTQPFTQGTRATAPNGALRLLARLSNANIPGSEPWLTADENFITADSTDVTADL